MDIDSVKRTDVGTRMKKIKKMFHLKCNFNISFSRMCCCLQM